SPDHFRKTNRTSRPSHGTPRTPRILGIAGLASAGDQASAFSRHGVAFYANLAGVRGTAAGDELTVSRSSDEGPPGLTPSWPPPTRTIPSISTTKRRFGSTRAQPRASAATST